MVEIPNPILTSPRTESQLRSVLSRLSQNITTLVVDLGDLEERIIRTDDASAAVAAGEVVYVSGAGTVAPAQANADLTSRVAGISLAAAALGAEVIYQSAGVVTGMSGLVANTFYYLSASTPGLLTSTAPSTAGQYVVLVGLALSTTELLLMQESGILL